MKKNILLLFLAVAVTAQSLSAQDYDTPGKKWWLDLQVAQHIGLTKWSNAGYVNDGLPAGSVTEIRGVLNRRPFIFPWLGAFFDAGLGIMPAPAMESLDISRLPMPNSGTRYYLRETVSESGIDQASAHFKFTVGLSGDFRSSDRLTVMPYFGVGGLTMSRRKYEMILKEDGSNMQYNTTYVWGLDSGEDYGSDGEMLGYVTGRLNFKYSISPRAGLLFGLEYTYFFEPVNFYGRYSNTFNGNVQRSFMVEGDKMSMLGFSLGLSFR